jgi:hypothetical protein
MNLASIRVLLVLLILFLSSCSEEEKLTSSALVGKWQLVEQKVGIGPPGEWTNVKDGAIYEFKTDGTFSISDHPLCTMGTYEVQPESLVLKNDCQEYTTEWIFSVKMNGSYFLISPTYPTMCTEGCLYKYKKVE